jgi:hypothetical protein
VAVIGPLALVVAGGNLVVGSLVPLGKGVDPREPEAKWYHAYAGAMRPAQEVAILCNRERSTEVTGLRPGADGAWTDARSEKWHFPVCIEVLPGSYEVEVHYFARETADDPEHTVTRQAESTAPSTVHWDAEAGRVYQLVAELGAPQPAAELPVQRRPPRSRALGTSWWELQESDWTVRIEPLSDWKSLSGPVVEQRRAWEDWEKRVR